MLQVFNKQTFLASSRNFRLNAFRYTKQYLYRELTLNEYDKIISVFLIQEYSLFTTSLHLDITY